MAKSFRGFKDTSTPKRLLAYYENMEKSLVCKNCRTPLKIESPEWHFIGTGFEHTCKDGKRSIAMPCKEKSIS